MSQNQETPAATNANPQGAEGRTARSILKESLKIDLKWVVPIFGGVGLLTHFWRIGYAPTLSLADLGTILAAMLMFSLIGLIVVVLLLFIPALFIAYWIESSILPPPHKSLKGDRAKRNSLKSYYRDGRKQEPAEESRTRKVERAFGMWRYFLFSSLFACALYVGIAFLYSTKYCETAIPMWITLLVLGATASVSTLFLLDWQRLRRKIPAVRKPPLWWGLLIALYLAFWPYAALVVGFLKMPVNGENWWYGLFVAVLIPLTHWIIYASYRQKSGIRILTIGANTVFLLVISGILLSLVDRAIEKFGFGLMRNTDLVLTQKGCDIVHAAWPERICLPDHRGVSAAYRLSQVDVLTRIGPDFLLAPSGGIDDRTRQRFTLPASEVLSWSRAPERKRGGNSCLNQRVAKRR